MLNTPLITPETFILLFVAVLVINTLWEIYLSVRQEKSIDQHQQQVPTAFAEHIDLTAHQKAANYNITKQRFGRLELIIGTLVVLFWTIGGGLSWLDTLVNQWQLSPFLNALAIIGIFSLISSIISLPFTLYQTFVIEQRFGFNKTTVKLFIIDGLKGTLLAAVIGIPFLWVILWLMEQFINGYWWLYATLFIIGFQLLMLWLYPAFIAPLFNKFKPLEDAELKSQINDLAKNCGFQADSVQVMDGSKRSSHGNAYFTGFGKNKKIVFFDTLLEKLTQKEIVAVLAHELGHYAKKHIIKRLTQAVFITLLSLLLLDYLIHSDWFYTAFNVQPSHIIALMLFQLVLPPFTSLLGPLLSGISRKHEFEADEFAADKTNATDLISALLALYRDNAATLTPDPLYSKWHDSHPPASQRINALNKLKRI